MLLSSPCRSCSSRWKPTRLAFRSSSLEESRSAASCWDPTAPSSSCRWSAAGPSADRLATFCSISRNISCTITQSQTVSSVLCSVVRKIPAEALNEVIIMRTLLTEGQSESFKSSTVTSIDLTCVPVWAQMENNRVNLFKYRTFKYCFKVLFTFPSLPVRRKWFYSTSMFNW